MEEIHIHENDQIKIYYLHLFNDHIHDENYFKTGKYLLNESTLQITFDNQRIVSYDYDSTQDNIKIFLNNTLKSFHIIHTNWEDDIDIHLDSIKRRTNNDSGKYKLEESTLTIEWDEYGLEIFHFDSENNVYRIQNASYVEIKNKTWTDMCVVEDNRIYRKSQPNEKGTITNKDSYLFIQWDQWSPELFVQEGTYFVNNDLFIKKINTQNEDFFIDQNCAFSNEYPMKYLETFIGFYTIKDNILFINDTSYSLEEEIILYDETSTYQYKDFQLINKSEKYPALLNEAENELIIQKEEQISYKKIHTIFFNMSQYNFLMNCQFDADLYKNFDDSFVNIIERIKEEECIYNQFSFEKKYIFLHPFKFLKKEMQDINIFSSYGFMFIEKLQIQSSTFSSFSINQNSSSVKDTLHIWILSDFSEYTYHDTIGSFNKAENIVCLIDYSKSPIMKYYYIKKLFYQLETHFNIQLPFHYNIVQKDLYSFVHTLYDFVLFTIFVYLNNYQEKRI